MKAAVWKRILEPVLPEGEEWAFRRTLCYRAPVDRILEGVLADTSNFSKSASLRRVMMPLFVPREYIVGEYGSDIERHRRFFEEDAAEIQEAVAPALRCRETEEQALRRIVALAVEIPRNWLLAEEAGYAVVLLGEDPAGAREFLARVVRGAATTDWPNETNQKAAQRAAMINGLLDRDEHEQVVSQLDAWCEYTAHALGVSYDHR